MIRSEGMIEHLVRGLKTENAELQQHCASAIFKVKYAVFCSTHTMSRGTPEGGGGNEQGYAGGGGGGGY